MRRRIVFRNSAVPDHLYGRHFGIDAPSGRRSAGPCSAEQVLADIGMRGERVKIRARGIGKPGERAEPARVAPRGFASCSESALRSGKAVPDDVVEQIEGRGGGHQYWSFGYQ